MGVGSALQHFSAAHAADTSGYKALVCVFFFGGLDHYDTVFPYDQASYDQLVGARQTLFDQYGGARSRDQLLPLSPDNAANFGGREFALAPQLSGLQTLFANGNAAIVGNVGPLIAPTTKLQIDNETAILPPRLFSHNDQQSTWQASAPEGAQFGWGGRFADAVLDAGGNGGGQEFTTITTVGNELFLTGTRASPYQVSVGGAASVRALDSQEDFRDFENGENLYQAMRRHFRAEDFSSPHLIRSDVANAIGSSFDANELFNNVLGDRNRVLTAFPQSSLGTQLKAVAETIAVRSELQTSRQVFFVGTGGFDTHSAQAQSLPALQADFDASIKAFFDATVELGRSSDVTLFTASDFGRTLAANGDGTDHGWGSHQFIVGGGVNGRQIYGDMPETIFDTEFDVGSGRSLPTTAVEEVAAPLGEWFGLSPTELGNALPNLPNFSDRPALPLLGPASAL